ncbi:MULTISPECIES: septum site-determining protein MinC [Spirulina sp. CCY15215]|uniref:septum site-determining protein MinC n=1 Tax=Spirulina sp. CCY15215 TaxID=2767591 RepID=UPI00195278A5|nr:septum site-determining protein MinC [Spirulina major]
MSDDSDSPISPKDTDLDELSLETEAERAPDPPKSPSPAKKEGDIALVNPRSQVRLVKHKGKLHLIFPTTQKLPVKAHWTEIWEQLKHRLNAGEQFWQPGTPIELIAADQLLDTRQLQTIAEALAKANLDLQRVKTSRRQTAVAAATAGYSVDQQTHAMAVDLQQVADSSAENWSPPMYIKSTVRSGSEVQHPGTIVVLGDTNPGSTLIAAGDILILGRLRGIAHAGSQGNYTCQILALQMEATQLRIGEAIARPPESPPEGYYPEIAYMTPSGIRLARAVNFFKTHSFVINLESWVDSFS